MILNRETQLNQEPINYTGFLFHPPQTAVLTKKALNTSALNAQTIQYEIVPEAPGGSRIYNTFELVMGQGCYNLVVAPFDLWGYGLRRRFNEFNLDGPGLASLGNLPFDGCAVGAHTKTNAFTLEAPGLSDLYAAYVANGIGGHGVSFDECAVCGAGLALVGYDTYEIDTPGLFVLRGYDSYFTVTPGKHSYALGVTLFAFGLTRVANDLTQYELYRGVDGDVDFSTPWETFTSFPHTTAALDVGHVYKFVLRKRNNYNLVSQNVKAWEVTTDATGSAELDPPSSPVSTLTATEGGKVLVNSVYDYFADADDQADQWLIYLTSDGSDPDPETDTPIVSSLVKCDGLGRLEYLSSAFTEGATIKVIVRVRRSSGLVDSTNTNILSVSATLLGPDEPQGGIFH